MILKKDVTLIGLQLPMRLVLKVANQIWDRHGQELTITAALEDGHSPTSFHPFGYALDFRTRYFTESEKRKVYDLLKYRLPSSYDVVWHSTHIHVEYDPK